MSSTATEKATLTEQEFCERVGISRTTAQQLGGNATLASCPIVASGIRLFMPRHVDEFLANCERAARNAAKKIEGIEHEARCNQCARHRILNGC